MSLRKVLCVASILAATQTSAASIGRVTKGVDYTVMIPHDVNGKGLKPGDALRLAFVPVKKANANTLVTVEFTVGHHCEHTKPIHIEADTDGWYNLHSNLLVPMLFKRDVGNPADALSQGRVYLVNRAWLVPLNQWKVAHPNAEFSLSEDEYESLDRKLKEMLEQECQPVHVDADDVDEKWDETEEKRIRDSLITLANDILTEPPKADTRLARLEQTSEFKSLVHTLYRAGSHRFWVWLFTDAGSNVRALIQCTPKSDPDWPYESIPEQDASADEADC